MTDAALVAACVAGDLAMVKRLVAMGANVNAAAPAIHNLEISADVGSQPCLMLAVQHGWLDIAQFLLDSGAEVNWRDGLGDTALTAAVRTGSRVAVQMLIGHGADVNRMGMDGTPLFSAIVGGHRDIVRLLLDRGAQINVASYYGETPLKLALEYEYKFLADLLRAHGATH